MSFVVGLTGGIGSGKSTVAELFARHGADIIDTDLIAHELTRREAPATVRLAERFGRNILDAEGSLDREKLRNLVFENDVARRDLEAILHPLIQREVIARISASNAPYVVIVIPLLVESGGRDLVDRVLVVDCSEETQIERVMRRSGMQRPQVLAIMRAQASRQERLAHADDTVNNEQSVEALVPQVGALHKRYVILARGA